MDEWDKVSIQIENTGNGKAVDITFSLSTDFETRGIKPVCLDAGATLSLDFGIKSKSKGKFPLEITTTYQDEINKKYNQTSEYWIEVINRIDPEHQAPQGMYIYGGNVHVGDKNQTEVTDSVLIRSRVGTTNLEYPPICPDCGEKISCNLKWCPNCGKKLK